MWERGVRESPLWGQPGRRLLATGLVAAVLVASVVAAVGLLVSAEPEQPPGLSLDRAGHDATVPERSPAHLRSYTLDGTDPEVFPEHFAALGFLELDDPLATARAELGPPHEQQPDINATTAHIWRLPGGAEFVAVAYPSEAGEGDVVGLAVDVPAGSAVRFAAYAGVVIGRSTPAEIARAWGPDFDRSDSPADDYVLRYIRCVGGWPVVVKFDQAEDGGSWDGAPVTRALIAYSDDDPTAGGCPEG
jgi:hypothetical protein